MIFPHSTNQIIIFGRRRCRCYRPCLSSLLNHVTYARVDPVSPQRRSQDHLPFYPFGVGDERSWERGWFLISYLTCVLTKASRAQARYYQEWGWAEKREGAPRTDS